MITLQEKQQSRPDPDLLEFKHAEDVLGDPEKVRLQKLVQDQERLILEANRNHTPLPANFQLNESKKNAYLERQEKTAYGAERRVLQELKNSKEQRKNNVKK